MRYCFRFLSALLFTGLLSATPETSPSPSIVPFELDEGHLIVIRSTLGQSRVPVRVMIDTGATHSILSRKTARKINAPSMGAARLTAFGSESQAERVILRGLRLGSRTITAACYSADLPWGKVDVLLGLDVLATADLVIDYKRRQLEFGSTSQSVHSVEFEFEGGLLAVHASIGGRPYTLSVDSGAPVTCLLEPATGVAIRPLKKQYDGILRRLGGTSDVQSAVLPDLRLGDVQWNDLPVWVVRGKRQTRSSLDGVIGLMSLGLQRVQFEFRAKRISWGEIQANRYSFTGPQEDPSGLRPLRLLRRVTRGRDGEIQTHDRLNPIQSRGHKPRPLSDVRRLLLIAWPQIEPDNQFFLVTHVSNQTAQREGQLLDQRGHRENLPVL
ncbi:MAG: hypothetical protein EHM61_09595 [Acidobacteria bacterium]|nr:MAG: hypothetical protein EHM61_09595 [Acidobacteriota bacterium]